MVILALLVVNKLLPPLLSKLPCSIFSTWVNAIPRRVLARYEQAVLAAPELFLDGSTFLSCSLSVAGMAYTLKSTNFYEYLSIQSVNLFALNPPIAVMILTWPNIRRRALRITMSLVACTLGLSFWILSVKTRKRSTDYTDALCYHLTGRSLPQTPEKGALLMTFGYLCFGVLAAAGSSLRDHGFPSPYI